MGFDKITDNGTLVLEDGCLNASLVIKDGKIAAILQDGCGADREERIDVGGRYVFPGGIDTHIHFSDPGTGYREDQECGTKVAAPGGYTLVIEMPNSSPPVIDEDTFRTKYECASQCAVVDFALWDGAIVGGNSCIGELRGLGCIAFKGFTLDAEPEFKRLDHWQQKSAMDEVKKHGRILGFHAEDENIISKLKKRFQDGPWNLHLHDMARPWYVEMIVVQSVVILPKASGCPLHICHLSVSEGAELIKEVKAEGVNVSTEDCAHYFLLNHEDNFSAGTYGLIQSPPRDRKRMEQMWEYLLDETIDYLGTDHAPYIKEDKEPEDGNRWNVMGGASSTDIAYPLMISEVVIERRMKASRLMDLCATNAAKRSGLYPRKGAVRVGADADLVPVDMDCRWDYSRKNSLSKTKCTSSPHEGKEVLCRVTETLVRGRAAYGDGVIWAVPGSGTLIKSQKGVIEMLEINKERLWERLQYVGGIGADPKGGISRFAWTPAYREVCEVLTGWIWEAGLTVRMDTVGNIYGKLEGQEDLSPILTGSHSDTVPVGGKFDGLAGVMAVLEVLTTLSENGIKLRRPIEMTAFVNEEASQFLGGHFGSKAICGMFPEDYVAAPMDRATGIIMKQVVLDFDTGLEPDNFLGSYIKMGDHYALIGLHIEQGCYLLHEDLPMAAMTDIAGIEQFYIMLHDVSVHAGGMAVEGRHDAMAAAVVIACKVGRLALESGSTTRGTVGYIEALPVEHNIVANQATMSVDFREKEDDLWQKLYDDPMASVEKQCRDRGSTYLVRSTINTEPVHCGKCLVESIGQRTGEEEIPHKYMVSYPAHDVIQMGRLYPMGMIFLGSSSEGVSHYPDEYTTPEDMVDGTAVLLRTAERLVQEDLLR